MSFRKRRPMGTSSDPILIFDQKCGCCVHGQYLNKHVIRCNYDGDVMHEMPYICPFWKGRTKEDLKP